MPDGRRVTEVALWLATIAATLGALFYIAFAFACEDDWCFGWGWFAVPWGFTAVASAAGAALVRRHRLQHIPGPERAHEP